MWVYGKVEKGWYVAAIQWDTPIANEWKAKGYAVELVTWPKQGMPAKPSYIPA